MGGLHSSSITHGAFNASSIIQADLPTASPTNQPGCSCDTSIVTSSDIASSSSVSFQKFGIGLLSPNLRTSQSLLVSSEFVTNWPQAESASGWSFERVTRGSLGLVLRIPSVCIYNLKFVAMRL